MPWTSANGRAKLEGFLSACDPIGEMALAGAPARLMVVGEGPAQSRVAALGRRAHHRRGCSSKLRTSAYSISIFERLWPILINAAHFDKCTNGGN